MSHRSWSKTVEAEYESSGAGDFGHKTLRHQDTLGHFGTTKLVPKFKTNQRWSCVSSELSWVEVFRLFLDHGTFLVSKCLETGAEVSQSVLMPKCPATESSPLLSSVLFTASTTISHISVNSVILSGHITLVVFSDLRRTPSIEPSRTRLTSRSLG